MPGKGEKMLVDKMILNNLYQEAEKEIIEKAKQYQADGQVKITEVNYEDDKNFEVRAIVLGKHTHQTFVSIRKGEIEEVTCTCEDYCQHYHVCEHALASIFTFSEEPSSFQKCEESEEIISNHPIPRRNVKQDAYRNFKQIVATFYNEEVEGMDASQETVQKYGNIRIEPKIYYDKFSGDMRVEFKIGNKKMYKIKNLAEFYTRMVNREFYRYGERLQFIHTEEEFEKESRELLDFLMKYAEIIKYANSNSNSNYKYYGKALNETSIIIGNSAMDDLFEVLNGKKVEIQRDYNLENIEFTQEQPKIEFKLEKTDVDQYVIVPNIEIYKVAIMRGKKYKYVLDDHKFYRCTKDFENTNLKLLELFRKNYMTEIQLGENELTQLFSVVLPKVKNAIYMDDNLEEQIKKYRPKELGVKVFLDFDEHNYIIAEVKFCYEDQEFNPLNEKNSVHFPRNKIQETQALNRFRKTGFMLDTKNLRFILPDNDKIYQFLTEDIDDYMQKFEVLVTENFKTKQIMKPKLGALGVKVENNLLTLNFRQLNIDPTEIQDIMEKYKLKKKYHRLKSGVFLDLQENEEINFLDRFVTGMGIEYQELEKEEISLPVARSLYLNQLLKGMKGTEIIKNQEYRKIVNDLNQETLEQDAILPQGLKTNLRYYQKTGFQWLKVLDGYHFGGILADDMGLRKNGTDIIYFIRLFGGTKRREKDKFSDFTKFFNIKLA